MQPPAVTPEPSDSGSREANGTPDEAAAAMPPGHEGAARVRDVIGVTWDRLDVGDDVTDLYGDDIVDLDAY